MAVYFRWITVLALFALLITVVVFGLKAYKQQTEEVANTNISKPVEEGADINISKPVEAVANDEPTLTDIQWEYLAQAYEHYYNQKILKSTQWAERARNHDLSLSEIMFLQTELQYRFQQELERQQQTNGE